MNNPNNPPNTPPDSSLSSSAISFPTDPSNPPSPDSSKDVPLRHLNSSSSIPPLPTISTTTTGIGSGRTTPTRRTTSGATNANSNTFSMSSSRQGGLSASASSTGGGNSSTARERKHSNPISQFRSSNSLSGSGLGGGSGHYSPNNSHSSPNRYRSRLQLQRERELNVKGKDRYSDGPSSEAGESLLGASTTGGGVRGLNVNGVGESDGEFDEGWREDGLAGEEEAMGLLGGNGKKTNKPAPSLLSTISPPLTASPHSRTIPFPSSLLHPSLTSTSFKKSKSKFAPNVVRNQKYNVVTFLPLVLYEQFKFFYNLYFLLVALSQFVPALRIGFLATYVVPLAFVLSVTIGKEFYDDYKRYLRDAAANSQLYRIISPSHPSSSPSPFSHHSTTPSNPTSNPNQSTGLPPSQIHLPSLPLKSIPSSKLQVGDLIYLEKNDRLPSDILLLKTSDPSGSCFVRTDQLDGETDWKLRVSLGVTQKLIEGGGKGGGWVGEGGVRGEVWAERPEKDIHNFVGNVRFDFVPKSTTTLGGGIGEREGTGTTNDLVQLTDDEPDLVVISDTGLTNSNSNGETEGEGVTYPLTAENMLWANTVLAAGSAIGMVIYTGRETRAVMNTSQPGTKTGLLDLEINRLAKILCSVTFALSVILVALNGFRGWWYVYVFRFLILFSSIIPISLRVNLDMGKTVYAHQIMHDNEIPGTIVRTSTLPEELGRIEYLLSDKTGTLTQNEMELKKLHLGTMSYTMESMDEVANQLATALGLPTVAEGGKPPHGRVPSVPTGVTLATRGRRDMSSRVRDVVLALGLCHNVTPAEDDDGSITYQASSPDEVAIVRWTESVGLTLSNRDRTSMSLRTTAGQTLSFDILEVFPFTSESKRMGIVIRDRQTREITFYQKGADVVMTKIVAYNDWLEEECGNMAREGLRTLVMARKRLSDETWEAFEEGYREARVSLGDRNQNVQNVISDYLERDLELLGVTGVEDKLQDDVKMTIELLRNAGIKIWMLTGDKIETATCIAISTKLVSRGQYIHQIAKLKSPADARDELEFLQTKLDCCLVIDGESLQLCIEHFRQDFIELTTKLSAVVACRCSPTQKADVARLIRAHTKKRVCCIGDGGNDVSMIQAADVGVGIVGKEGRQASLAADFSIDQFSFLTKLLVWHGRNSYKRSAKLAQFVIHRGLIISIIQAVFSSVFYFSPIAIYQGWLMVGYATAYTMLPVFSLVLDRDVNEDVALLYPELYKELTKGRSLSYKTFFTWLMISLYQGGAIMICSLIFFESEFLNIVSISFTALVLNELLMVAVEITTWHTLMMLSEVVTLCLYVVSILFLPEYFDLSFVLTTRFIWKVVLIVAISAAPLWLLKILQNRFAPTQYAKLAY